MCQGRELSKRINVKLQEHTKNGRFYQESIVRETTWKKSASSVVAKTTSELVATGICQSVVVVFMMKIMCMDDLDFV